MYVDTPSRRSSSDTKRAAEATLFGVIPLLFLLKGVLAEAADGALEVLGKILEGRTGGDLFSHVSRRSRKPYIANLQRPYIPRTKGG